MQVDGLTNDEVKSHLQVRFSHDHFQFINQFSNFSSNSHFRNTGFTRGEFLRRRTHPPPCYGRRKSNAASRRSRAIRNRARRRAPSTCRRGGATAWKRKTTTTNQRAAAGRERAMYRRRKHNRVFADTERTFIKYFKFLSCTIT